MYYYYYPFAGQGKWDTEVLNEFPEAVCLYLIKTRFEPWLCGSRICSLTMFCYLFNCSKHIVPVPYPCHKHPHFLRNHSSLSKTWTLHVARKPESGRTGRFIPVNIHHKGPGVALCVPHKIDLSTNQSKIKQSLRGRINQIKNSWIAYTFSEAVWGVIIFPQTM